MRQFGKSIFLNSYIMHIVGQDETRKESQSIYNKLKQKRFLAFEMVKDARKKYSWNLFIGDSRTPIGTYQLTLIEAFTKNKAYRDKLFGSSDDEYRLRTLHLTKESLQEVKKDKEEAFIYLSDKQKLEAELK